MIAINLLQPYFYLCPVMSLMYSKLFNSFLEIGTQFSLIILYHHRITVDDSMMIVIIDDSMIDQSHHIFKRKKLYTTTVLLIYSYFGLNFFVFPV